jgi:hypothetical protein
MYALLGPERLKGFYSYPVFKSFSSIGRCLVNMNIPDRKIRALEKDPKKQDCDFIEKIFNDFYYIVVICGDHICK